MTVFDDVNSLNVETLEMAPKVFDSTLKSFDVQAVNLKRGFQVNQALNGLRTLDQLNRELKSRKTRSYSAISYRPDNQHE
jgi:hypothetical protein